MSSGTKIDRAAFHLGRFDAEVRQAHVMLDAQARRVKELVLEAYIAGMNDAMHEAHAIIKGWTRPMDLVSIADEIAKHFGED